MIANWIDGADVKGLPITENDAIRKRTRRITFSCYATSLSMLAMMTAAEWPNLAAGGPWVRDGPWVTKAPSTETSGISEPVQNNADLNRRKTNHAVSTPQARYKTPSHHGPIKHTPK